MWSSLPDIALLFTVISHYLSPASDLFGVCKEVGGTFPLSPYSDTPDTIIPVPRLTYMNDLRTRIDYIE